MSLEVMAITFASLLWLVIVIAGMFWAVRLKCETVLGRFCFGCLCAFPLLWIIGFLSSSYTQYAGGSARIGERGPQFTLVSHGISKQVSQSTWRTVIFLETFSEISSFWTVISMGIPILAASYFRATFRSSA